MTRGDTMIAGYEKSVMGKVVVAATIENLDDLYRKHRGEITDAEVRRVSVTDALIETGATTLLLPHSVIAQLGLHPTRQRSIRCVGGARSIQIYSAVQLTVQGRDCVVDVGEIDDGLPVLIGQVPLELMDWVVDPAGQRLIGNPEHGGVHMIDVL